MPKNLFLFVWLSIFAGCFCTNTVNAQAPVKKHVVRKKPAAGPVAKDSTVVADSSLIKTQVVATKADTAIAKDSIPKKKTVSAKKQGKKGTKKKPVPQTVVNDSTAPAVKDTAVVVKDSTSKKTPGVKKQTSIKGAKKNTGGKQAIKEEVPQKDTMAEEKDTVKVTFGKNIVNLRTLNGWIKDEKGRWISSPNRIPYTNPDFNNELYNRYELGSENIKQINIVEVKIDSEPYLAVIIEQFKGHYRDNSDSNFRIFNGADFFLIHREDFTQMWNDTMKMKKPYEVNLKTYYSGLVGYKDIKLRPKYMASEINKDLRNKKYTDTAVKIYLQFGMMPTQNKTGKYMRFNYRIAYARDGQTIPPFDFGSFKHRFYETDLELFHKFSRPSSIKVIKKPKPVPVEIKKPEIKQERRPLEE